MEIRTGVDLIEVERVQKCIEEHGDLFLNRIYTKKEIEYCDGKGLNKYQSYAARFAAKEAVFKAISELLNNKFDIEWKDIEIINNSVTERPEVNLKINTDHHFQIDVSLSHLKQFAIASVVCKID